MITAAPRTLDDASKEFTRSYLVAFDRLKAVELSDTQTRITRLGAKGKAFQAQLDGLRQRQGELSDLLVQAVEKKKKALTEKRIDGVDEAAKLLTDADQRAQRLAADVAQLNEKLTAAGAPLIDPGPPRDPNARD